MTVLDKNMDIFYLIGPMQKSALPPAFISRQIRKGKYYFGDLGSAASNSIRVTCAGDEECEDDYEMKRRNFRYHAVEFIVSGRWKLTIGEESHDIGPGHAFCYGPRQGYHLAACGGEKPRKYFMDFQGRRSAGLLEKIGLTGSRPVLLPNPSSLTDLFDQLVESGSLPPPWIDDHAALLCELILRTIAVANTELPSPTDNAYGTYQKVRRIILQEHTQIDNVTSLARKTGLNAAYLSRLFKRHSGESPLRFLTRTKMQHAADLMLRHSARVEDAATAVGFTDPFHFSRVFKRIYGVCPRDFLNQPSAHRDD